MTDGSRRRGGRRTSEPEPQDAWLVEVAKGASHDAGGGPVELLGDYLTLLADAATYGRRAKRRGLDAVGLLGRRAAEQGISAGRVVQLYLSAARRLWQDLPMVVRSRDREEVRAAAAAVLQVVDKAVATLAEGYAVARRDLVRREETLRRELIDDLNSSTTCCAVIPTWELWWNAPNRSGSTSPGPTRSRWPHPAGDCRTPTRRSAPSKRSSSTGSVTATFWWR